MTRRTVWVWEIWSVRRKCWQETSIAKTQDREPDPLAFGQSPDKSSTRWRAIPATLPENRKAKP
jgi:hypothetical protein